jgi:hypothetical protein
VKSTLPLLCQVSHYPGEKAIRIDSNSAEGVFLTPTGHTLQESSTVTFDTTRDRPEQHRALRDTSGQDDLDFLTHLPLTPLAPLREATYTF